MMNNLTARIKQLEEACGEIILNPLRDPLVTELMLNPDSILWIEHRQNGVIQAGEVSPGQAERIIRKIAGIVEAEVNYDNPILECEFPIDHSRFEGVLPPLVKRPSFTIRKKAEAVYTFDDYIRKGALTAEQARVIRQAIAERKNILVCGGPGTGKTTFVNACIYELTKIAPESERLLILEDVPELQCSAKNVVQMVTNRIIKNPVDLQKLIFVAMRSRPDRILIGEVRDKAMLDLMKAWNTGCPGGIATVHANDTHSAVQRCLSLAEEAGVEKPISLLLETIYLIVAIERNNFTLERRVKNISSLEGYDPLTQKFSFKELN